MKKLAFFIVITGLFMAGCKTQQKATTDNYDDVYYSKPKPAQSASKDASSQDLSAPKYVTSPDSSSTVKSASASPKEDNSDYSYSSRLKRFHDPVGKLGYYDNVYTNSQNSDSSSGNTTVNVYGGSGWGSFYGDPYFSMGMGFGGWGFGWDWGYPYNWYYPYYSWGPPCYYCGYYGYGGHNPYWDYGYGNYYNGRRSRLSSNNGTGNRNIRTLPASPISDRPRNNAGTSTGRNSRSTVNPAYSRTTEVAKGNINPTPQPIVNRTPADQQRYKYQQNNAQKNTSYQRNMNKNNQGQHATPRYVKPENSTPSRAGQAQIYSSPAYRQPKSSQEYISPRNQENQNSGNNTSRYNSTPSNNVRRYGNGNNTRSYSPPSNNNGRNSYIAPSRSFTPGNSSPSRSYNNSSPSRSGGGNYSAPARSGNSGGGNSGGGNSGGGGGGGHRR